MRAALSTKQSCESAERTFHPCCFAPTPCSLTLATATCGFNTLYPSGALGLRARLSRTHAQASREDGVLARAQVTTNDDKRSRCDQASFFRGSSSTWHFRPRPGHLACYLRFFHLRTPAPPCLNLQPRAARPFVSHHVRGNLRHRGSTCALRSASRASWGAQKFTPLACRATVQQRACVWERGGRPSMKHTTFLF